MASQRRFRGYLLGLLASALFVCFIAAPVAAQNNLTGAFEGTVFDSTNPSKPVIGATVQFTYQVNGVQRARRTDANGRFYEGNLLPGDYTITVTAPGYKTKELVRSIYATRINEVRPVPVPLEPEGPVTTPSPGVGPVSPTPSPSPGTPAQLAQENKERPGIEDINTTNAQRGGVFTDKETSTLPLGGTTLVRTFDELALLLPGVATPPQTQGSVAGPGVGPGVGSAGQFAVNGLRSRANNFTVDGSDNNDEDIGVRRQGFLALVPQPIESIKEYQVISLLAPAQYGRNIGAQVNAVSKSGTKSVHGTVYGFFNSSQLNSRNFFDTTNGKAISALRSGNNQAVLLNGNPIMVQNQSGAEDSFTLGHFGGVVGGPIVPDKMFYFFSAEGQILNATKEESFAVPTVEQRGILGSGATGLFRSPLATPVVQGIPFAPAGSPTRAFPTTSSSDAIFSLFPFPNNPTGVYGVNTFTQTLPASGRGVVLSAKIDDNFKFWDKPQSLAARYNFTNDWRDVPATGGAIFSSLRPRIRTQNFSTFLNSELTGANSTRPIFNQLRLSYGRTRLNFEELRDPSLLPSAVNEQTFGGFGLLNAPYRRNLTLPTAAGVANTGPVTYFSGATIAGFATTEQALKGPVGQVMVAGFSPIGIDVFNFPQRRVNNTYQLADTLTLSAGKHNLAFGTDNRRTELNSDLPRNSRPLITINGAPQLAFDAASKTFSISNKFISPIDLAAGGAASGFAQTVVLPGNDSHIDLRYYQWNVFGQDEWRIKRNLSLSFGLRYEYNTPPREVSKKIEKTFNVPELDVVPGLSNFIDGRKQIFDPDRNNFGPRIGVAYSPNFGSKHSTVIRGGYGLYFDQIPGAVVSQSRNVFPTFLTFNIPGGAGNTEFASGVRPFPYGLFTILNPTSDVGGGHHHVDPTTLNVLANPEHFTVLRELLQHHIAVANSFANGGGFLPPASGFGTTLPTRRLDLPMAHQYAISVEHKLSQEAVLSIAYVGTQGRNLLRFTTPNLGQDSILAPLAYFILDPNDPQPSLFGLALPPGFRISSGQLGGGRPVATVGTVNRFETTAESRYDALQIQIRGRFSRSLQYQTAYTFSKATDDVSDVFDVAGASALPQNNLKLAAEHGPANYDARHRFSYNFIYDFPDFKDRSGAFRFLFGDLQFAGTGQFQSGQPFTVNSIFDVNLDGNLTDRLNTTSGISVTGDRRQPLKLTADPTTMLAAIGQDGSIGRNSFRAGSLLDFDVSVIKNFKFSEERGIALRMDVFNFINRANFGIPVRFLEAPGFGQATNTVTPGRRLQLALKFTF
jgi:Carboxypeptidase regulatory-like domain/TonB dependent receptor